MMLLHPEKDVIHQLTESCLRQLSTVINGQLLRSGSRLRAIGLQLLHNIHSFNHSSEDNMLSIQP